MGERIEKARGRLTICGMTRILLIFVLFQVATDVIPQAVRSAFANPSGVNDQSALVGFWVIGDRNWIVADQSLRGRILRSAGRPEQKFQARRITHGYS